MKQYLRWAAVAALVFAPAVFGTGCGGSDKAAEEAIQEAPADMNARQNILNSERARERRGEFGGGEAAEGGAAAPAEGATGQQ